MKSFYMITNRQKDKQLQTTATIREYLNLHGKECLIADETFLQQSGYTNPDEIPERADCILVLGGDGTLLQAARDTLDRQIPLLGVNMGTLGYLAEVELANLEEALEQLMHEEFVIEERMMLTGRMQSKGSEPIHALNDIVITRGGSLQIIRFQIYVNGQLLNQYHADGVIISTPTGSTGYNMSAGGPIVEPKANLMVLTPICPHTLNARSIILSAEDEVVVEICEGRDGKQQVEVNFDGTQRNNLYTGERIFISKSDKKVRIVKLSQVSFLTTLHKKMKNIG